MDTVGTHTRTISLKNQNQAYSNSVINLEDKETIMSNQYWARAPGSEIASEILAKWSEHEKWLSDSGYGAMVQKFYDQFYGLKNGGHDIDISVDGTDASISVNHFKSLMQRLHSLTTQSKLLYSPRSRNSDAASQMESDLTRGLLEYYGDEKNMNGVVSDMTESGVLALDSYVFAPWDENEGELIRTNPTTLEEIRTGDQAFHVLTKFNVMTHPTLNKTPFHIVKLQVNKYDLAAIYKKQADYILSLSDENTLKENVQLRTPFNSFSETPADDVVSVYWLFHDRTPSLARGRETLIVGTEVLRDGALRYKTVPVVHFQPGKMHGTNSGDSVAKILYAPQRAIDEIYSSNLSNNLHYNKQNIWSQQAIQIEKLSEGYNNIICPTKPEALQLTQSSAESYKLLQGFEGIMQTLSGVNSTARGNPEASLKSGTSLAMMLSIAVMSADTIQKNYVQACSELATIVIHNLQIFATEERVAYIGGVSKQSFAKKFKNEDIKSIDRVSVDVGNPLLSNMAGRYELVQQWMQFGVLRDPVKLIEFIRTGQIDSLTENPFKQTVLIRSENEAIRKGELPPVAMFDDHPDHIIEHRALADDPEVRRNPVILKNLLAHVMDHIKKNKEIDPDLAAILGLAPLPSQQQAMQNPNGQPMDQPQEELPQVPNQLPDGAPPVAQEAYEEFEEQVPAPLQ
ncbi:MAG TPA: hypothetical protein V6C65_26160 [Allocoleopsis sp.]